MIIADRKRKSLYRAILILMLIAFLIMGWFYVNYRPVHEFKKYDALFVETINQSLAKEAIKEIIYEYEPYTKKAFNNISIWTSTVDSKIYHFKCMEQTH